MRPLVDAGARYWIADKYPKPDLSLLMSFGEDSPIVSNAIVLVLQSRNGNGNGNGHAVSTAVCAETVLRPQNGKDKSSTRDTRTVLWTYGPRLSEPIDGSFTIPSPESSKNRKRESSGSAPSVVRIGKLQDSRNGNGLLSGFFLP